MKKSNQKDEDHSFEPALNTHTHNLSTRTTNSQFLE